MSDVEMALSIYGQHGGGVQGVRAVWYAGYGAGRSDRHVVSRSRYAAVNAFMDAFDELEAAGLTDAWLHQPGVQRGLARLALLMDNTRGPGGPT